MVAHGFHADAEDMPLFVEGLAAGGCREPAFVVDRNVDSRRQPAVGFERIEQLAEPGHHESGGIVGRDLEDSRAAGADRSAVQHDGLQAQAGLGERLAKRGAPCFKPDIRRVIEGGMAARDCWVARHVRSFRQA